MLRNHLLNIVTEPVILNVTGADESTNESPERPEWIKKNPVLERFQELFGEKEDSEVQIVNQALPIYMPKHKPQELDEGNLATDVHRCDSCGDSFHINNSLKRHLERRSVYISYFCNDCASMQYFYNRCTLLNHIANHGTQVEEECKKITISPIPLEFALEQYEVENPKENSTETVDHKWLESVCTECAKPLLLETERKDHFVGVLRSPNSAFLCDKCNVICLSKCGLSAHKRIHTQAEPFVCPECGKLIQGPGDNFVEHLTKKCFHFARKIGFSCPKCSCIMTDKSTLMNHFSLKHSLHFFKCELCPMAFQNLESVVSHRNSVHSGIEVNTKMITKCGFCERVFDLFPQLESHLEMHYQAGLFKSIFCFQCPVCPELKSSQKDIASHITKSHTSYLPDYLKVFNNNSSEDKSQNKILKCSVCGLDFATDKDWTDHVQSCVQKNKRCNACGETFRKRAEVLVHGKEHIENGEKICLFCNNRVLDSYEALRLHLRGHSITLRYPTKCSACNYALGSSRMALSHFLQKHKIESPINHTKEKIIKENIATATVNDSVKTTKIEENSKIEEIAKVETDSNNNNGPKYYCWICNNQTFTKKITIKSHMRLAHGIQNIDLGKCLKPVTEKPKIIKTPLQLKEEYEYPSPLKKLKWDYVEPSEFKCSRCDYKSKDREVFDKHIVEHKPNKSSCQCRECGICFVVKPPLEKHLMSFHKIKDLELYYKYLSTKDGTDGNDTQDNSLDCNVCELHFENEQLLRAHLRTHGSAYLQLQKKNGSTTQKS